MKPRHLAEAFLVAFGLAGCAAPGSALRSDSAGANLADASTAPASRFGPSRAEAVSLARDQLGRTQVRISGRHYPEDCTGLVRGIFDAVGVPLLSDARRGENGVTSIFRYAEDHGRVFRGGRPLPGDLVFFRDTYDLNHDGHFNDGLTHVGLVESVDSEGTVNIIHRVRRGVVRFHMNLERPDDRLDPKSGRPLNDYLRAAGGGQKSVLTAQLFTAYASVLPIRAEELPMPNVPVLRPQPVDGSI